MSISGDEDGAKKFEEWLETDYPRVCSQIYQDGKQARKDGVNKEDNPHRVKIYRGIWEQGWNDG